MPSKKQKKLNKHANRNRIALVLAIVSFGLLSLGATYNQKPEGVAALIIGVLGLCSIGTYWSCARNACVFRKTSDKQRKANNNFQKALTQSLIDLENPKDAAPPKNHKTVSFDPTISEPS